MQDQFTIGSRKKIAPKKIIKTNSFYKLPKSIAFLGTNLMKDEPSALKTIKYLKEKLNKMEGHSMVMGWNTKSY